MKRKEILAHHVYAVWESKDGLWMTYLPGPENTRKLRKRKTREALEDLIVKFYRDLETELYMKDVFQEWAERRCCQARFEQKKG